MLFTCTFCFKGGLNDFLPQKRKEQPILHSLKTPASAKDAIEALGVPHVEVMKLAVNGEGKDIRYLLQPDDSVVVFPFEKQFPPSAPKAFVLDVHLGKLARMLRMLGIDVFYHNHLTDSEIISIAVEQRRAVLTRDIGLLKHKVLDYGYWLQSQQPVEQLMETVQWFSLCTFIQPFSRCMACNGWLQQVNKEEVERNLPAQTKQYFTEFYQCAGCGKIFWKGSHYENMQQLVQRVRSVAC